jgi:hypothetical protein
MPNTVTSPNMNIVVPVNLTDPSPDWGARIQAAFFATVDAHDHSSGKGVQITPAGMNINADLSFGGFNETNTRSTRYVSQVAPLALGSDVGCVYVSNGELWYNDLASHQVQLTNAGAVQSAPQAFVVKTVTTSYTILSTDNFQLFYYLSNTAATAIALPSSATVAAGRAYYFADRDGNGAANALTISPNGSDTINGINAPLIVPVSGALVIMTTDAAGRWTANIVQPTPVTNASNVGVGSGTTTLTATQLKSDVIKFTGTLTGAVTVVFPNAPGKFVCDFSQVVMGANTIAIQSGSSTSAAFGSSVVGSTVTASQLSLVDTFGSNTLRVKM